MANIPDAPWIRETESTGHSTYGYWNHPPKERDYDDDGLTLTVYMDDDEDDEEDDFEGGDGDVFYGNQTDCF